MKIVKLIGGLGNQMFQYAFALELERRSGEPVCIDVSGYESYGIHNGFELELVFGIKPKLATKADIKRLSTSPKGVLSRLRRKYLTKKTHFIDRYFGYYPAVFELEGDQYLDGYWQSERYFEGARDDVLCAFSFSASIGARNQSLLESLRRPALSVHVRRGDYLKSENLNVCGGDYYRRAIELALTETGAASLMVFSDDLPWCRSELGLDPVNAIYVDWNVGAESWRDMALMAECDHHVIANSSFSWWGAYLDRKPGAEVFAPAIWNMRQLKDNDPYYSFKFDDILPARWRRIPV